MKAPATAQAHVEDKIKGLKAIGAQKLPRCRRRPEQCLAPVCDPRRHLTVARLRHFALVGDLKVAEFKTLRYWLSSGPANIVSHVRRRILKIPHDWGWGLLTSSTPGTDVLRTRIHHRRAPHEGRPSDALRHWLDGSVNPSSAPDAHCIQERALDFSGHQHPKWTKFVGPCTRLMLGSLGREK